MDGVGPAGPERSGNLAVMWFLIGVLSVGAFAVVLASALIGSIWAALLLAGYASPIATLGQDVAAGRLPVGTPRPPWPTGRRYAWSAATAAWWSPRRPWFVAAAAGGLLAGALGLFVASTLARIDAEMARRAAQGCVAGTFGGCGLGRLGFGLALAVLVPVTVLVSTVVLRLLRLLRSWETGLAGGALSVLIGQMLALATPLMGSGAAAGFAAAGGLGYGLSAVAHARDVSPLVRVGVLLAPIVVSLAMLAYYLPPM